MCVCEALGIDTVLYRPTLCPGTSSFQDISMVRPLSLLFPISQCFRSSGGRRGIPYMLNICSLFSSWVVVTSCWDSE